MKKIFIVSTMLAMFVGSLLSSCGTQKKETQVAEEQDSVEKTVPTKVSSNHGKVLVAYFTVPETDGVDASSGASRVNVDGKTLFNIILIIWQKWRAYFGARNTTCTSKTWFHAHLVPHSRQPMAADSKES